MTSVRTSTAVDAAAERYLQAYAALDPCEATKMGLTEYDDEITDFSPDGVRARAETARSTLAELATLSPADEVDTVTLGALRERLGIQVELHDAGLDIGVLNNIASPLQAMRNVFDLMPTDTDEDWALIATRMSRIPDSAAGYAESLRTAAAGAHPPAIRQVRRGVDQAGQIAELFVAMADDAAVHSDTLRVELRRRADEAAAAYRRLATVLAEDIAPRARSRDACGRDAYRLFSRAFLGAVVDLDETYEWGLELLKGIQAEQESIADRLYPGSSVAQALDRLDAEPRYVLHGVDALQAWMQDLSDRAVAALADEHFDIPDPLRQLECCIAPTSTGGIYYTGPTEDLSRPGRMWWSVAPGVYTFHTWQETTTVFHEGVPGHHLQIGRSVLMADRLNRWRRLGCFVSGHGEGWALYAERLMAELGWLDDAGDRMGMLDAQRFRAARVVIDIGVHCGMTTPDGGVWDAGVAAEFLARHTVQSEEKRGFELDRYLGWPGQAPAYAVGQRIWEQLREEMTARGWSLKQFHSRALDLGGLPLDVLRAALVNSGD